eukprot:Skav217880  [mRNA]  locus=scaffold67:29382:32904:- [translate_table: standard]
MFFQHFLLLQEATQSQNGILLAQERVGTGVEFRELLTQTSDLHIFVVAPQGAGAHGGRDILAAGGAASTLQFGT